jgi:hypothetical protein
MIASLGDIKSILGYTDTSHDLSIMALIPMVESEVVNYCNNTFIYSSIYFAGEIACTVASGPVYSFDCADGDMDDAELSAGDIVFLEDSNRNDGYYTIYSLAPTQIIVNEKLIAQTASDLTLYLVQVPAGLKIYIAKMIAYQINHASDAGLTGESIGNYSYSRKDGGTSDAGYPAEMLRGLDKWKRITSKRGTVRIQYRDYRGYGARLAGDTDDC